MTTTTTTTAIDPREAGRQQRRQIQAARELLKPSEVRLHHVPRWLARRIRAKLGKSPRSYHSAFDDVQRAAAATAANGSAYWLDHFGSTTFKGRPAFVAEPYLSADMIPDAIRFAELLGLTFDIRPNSWWYPGQTTRLVFQEPIEPEVGQLAVPAAGVAQDAREQAGVASGPDCRTGGGGGRGCRP